MNPSHSLSSTFPRGVRQLVSLAGGYLAAQERSVRALRGSDDAARTPFRIPTPLAKGTRHVGQTHRTTSDYGTRAGCRAASPAATTTLWPMGTERHSKEVPEAAAASTKTEEMPADL